MLLFLREFFLIHVVFQLLQQKYVIQKYLFFLQQKFHSVCFHVEYIPNIRRREMNVVRQDQRFS